jgi:hypothetical protein
MKKKELIEIIKQKSNNPFNTILYYNDLQITEILFDSRDNIKNLSKIELENILKMYSELEDYIHYNLLDDLNDYIRTNYNITSRLLCVQFGIVGDENKSKEISLEFNYMNRSVFINDNKKEMDLLINKTELMRELKLSKFLDYDF